MQDLIALLEHPKVVTVKLWKRRPDEDRVNIEVELISGETVKTHNIVQFLANELRRAKESLK